MRPLLIAILLCSTCLGQTITPTKVNVTSGYTNPKVVGPYVLHGDFSVPVSRPGVLLTIETAVSGQKIFRMYAEQIPSLDKADLQPLPDGTALLVGEGTYRVTAFFESPSEIKWLTVELGKPKPPPEPEPEPAPVPPDSFDNIGQRVAGWSKGLPKRGEVAELYAICAADIENTPMTQNQAINKMVAAREALLKPDEQALYKPLLDNLNADIKKRWPMAAKTAASYFNAIAAGLVGAK